MRGTSSYMLTWRALAVIIAVTLNGGASAVVGAHGSPGLRTRTASPHSEDTDTATRRGLQKLFSPEKRVRDFAPFVTERGEHAFLVLFVTGAKEPADSEQLDPMASCGSMDAGIALVGTYHIALVVGRHIINEVTIPSSDPPTTNPTFAFPLRNFRWVNYWGWGQGARIEYGAPGFEDVEPTKLLKLADFNGDGHAWEFRLMHGGDVCGHAPTLLAGYSAKQRRAIVCPVITGRVTQYWYDNLFPHPERIASSTILHEFHCGDHGNDVLEVEGFEYNPGIEAWVMTRRESHLCIEESGQTSLPMPMPTEVQVHIGSARGRPGDSVTIPLTMEPHGMEVSGVEIEMMLPYSSFEMVGCDCNRAEPYSTDTKIASTNARVVVVAPFSNTPIVQVCTCAVHIETSAEPGAYSIASTGLLVAHGFEHLHATATDGQIVVDPSEVTPHAAP